MTGGWGTPKAKPPSNDPERPPKGPASGTLANPRRTQVDVIINIAGPVQHCPADCPCHIEENHD